MTWWWKSGGLQLTSSTGHSEDSVYNNRFVMTEEIHKINICKSKSDIYNIFLSASLTSTSGDWNHFTILPHLEYRRSINKVEDKREDVLLRNSNDTTINSDNNYKKQMTYGT